MNRHGCCRYRHADSHEEYLARQRARFNTDEERAYRRERFRDAYNNDPAFREAHKDRLKTYRLTVGGILSGIRSNGNRRGNR